MSATNDIHRATNDIHRATNDIHRAMRPLFSVGRLKTKEGSQNFTIQGVVVKKRALKSVTSLVSHQDGHTQLQGT